ncbi:MAG: histidine phosphatase family protein [Lachnospiraceae bacterium]|nr:histidine phosphatase family protein [Lachnospiraceae bacterium]
MKLYVIRHGETEMNSRGVLQGWIDGRLNQNGRSLAVTTGRAMKGIRFDKCISSPLIRAKETVEIVLRESGNDIPVQLDDRIREISFGRMENKKLPELGENGLMFLKDPFRAERFPGGECVQDVCKRTQEFLKELVEKDDGLTYLIGVHGCAVRAMLNYLYEDPSDFWQGHVPYNCAVNILEAEGGVIRFVERDKLYYDPGLAVDHYKQ